MLAAGGLQRQPDCSMLMYISAVESGPNQLVTAGFRPDRLVRFF